jgi:antitoxin VapB
MSISKSESERRVSLFRNGRNQAIRIPRELELPGREALLHKDGDRLIIEPIAEVPLLDLIEGWEPIETDWPEVDDPVPGPVELTD